MVGECIICREPVERNRLTMCRACSASLERFNARDERSSLLAQLERETKMPLALMGWAAARARNVAKFKIMRERRRPAP